MARTSREIGVPTVTPRAARGAGGRRILPRESITTGRRGQAGEAVGKRPVSPRQLAQVQPRVDLSAVQLLQRQVEGLPGRVQPAGRHERRRLLQHAPADQVQGPHQAVLVRLPGAAEVLIDPVEAR